MSFTVTIGGVTVTTRHGSIQIDGAIGQRSTCQFDVIDLNSINIYTMGSLVSILDDASHNVFYGFVDNSTEGRQGYSGSVGTIHTIQCADGHYLADKRRAAKAYANTLAGDIVSDLVANYLSQEGIIGQNFRDTDASQAAFNTGTLTRMAGTANNGGDLEINSLGGPAFTRSTVAEDPNTGASITSGTPRYVTGAAGQALFIEEGTTNLLTANQSNVETDLTGITAATATVTRDATTAWQGSASAKSVTSSGSSAQGLFAQVAAASFTASETITVSAWIKGISAGVVLRVFIYELNTSHVIGTATLYTTTTSFARVSCTATLPNPLLVSYGIRIDTNTSTATTFWVDGMQVEAGDHATSWQIGGTARNAETLSISMQGVTKAAGTIEVYAQPTANSLSSTRGVVNLITIGVSGGSDTQGIRVYQSGGNWFLAYDDNAGHSATSAGYAVSNTTAGTWYYFGLDWTAGGTFHLYLNGSVVQSLSSATFTGALATSAFIGSTPAGAGQFDGYYDSLRLSDIARSSGQETTQQGAGAPLGLDRNAATIMQFDNNLNYGIEGYRLTSVVNATNCGVVSAATVTFTDTTPASTTALVEVSIDNGSTWNTITSGSTISGLVGLDTTTMGTPPNVILRETLTSTNLGGAVPYFSSVTLLVHSNQIDDGPTVTSAIFSYARVSDCIDSLNDQSLYWWIIDYNKRLWFKAIGSITSPFSIDSTSMENDSVSVVRTTPLYRNRQYVVGVIELTATQTETRQGDGKTRAFTMSYELNAMPSTFTVNAAPKTLGVKGVNTSGFDFYWAQGDAVIAQDGAGTLLTSSDTISCTYVGQFPAVVQADDNGQQAFMQGQEGGGTTGIVEDAIIATNVATTAQGFLQATSALAKFSVQGYQVQFDTLLYGLQPGQLLTISIPEHNITSDTVLIDSIAITDNAYGEDDFSLTYKVHCIQGPANTTWVQYFAGLSKQNQSIANINLGSSATLALLASFTASWPAWSATLTATVNACTFPGASVYPVSDSSLLPC